MHMPERCLPYLLYLDSKEIVVDALKAESVCLSRFMRERVSGRNPLVAEGGSMKITSVFSFVLCRGTNE